MPTEKLSKFQNFKKKLKNYSDPVVSAFTQNILQSPQHKDCQIVDDLIFANFYLANNFTFHNLFAMFHIDLTPNLSGHVTYSQHRILDRKNLQIKKFIIFSNMLLHIITIIINNTVDSRKTIPFFSARTENKARLSFFMQTFQVHHSQWREISIPLLFQPLLF